MLSDARVDRSPSPAILIDPHNRDPPDVTPLSPFDISCAYGSDNSPPSCIVQVLNAKRAALLLDGRPGFVDSVRIPMNTDDEQLFAESPRHVNPLMKRIIDD